MYNYRIVAEHMPGTPDNVVLNTPEKTAQFLLEHCFKKSEMWREHCFVLTANCSCVVNGAALVSVGGTSKTIFDRKIICKYAVETLSDAVIIAHNHLSGNPLPSPSDIEETQRIKNALSVLGITLLDHVIVCEDSFYSFHEEIKGTFRKNDNSATFPRRAPKTSNVAFA